MHDFGETYIITFGFAAPKSTA